MMAPTRFVLTLLSPYATPNKLWILDWLPILFACTSSLPLTRMLHRGSFNGLLSPPQLSHVQSTHAFLTRLGRSHRRRSATPSENLSLWIGGLPRHRRAGTMKKIYSEVVRFFSPLLENHLISNDIYIEPQCLNSFTIIFSHYDHLTAHLRLHPPLRQTPQIPVGYSSTSSHALLHIFHQVSIRVFFWRDCDLSTSE